MSVSVPQGETLSVCSIYGRMDGGEWKYIGNFGSGDEKYIGYNGVFNQFKVTTADNDTAQHQSGSCFKERAKVITAVHYLFGVERSGRNMKKEYIALVCACAAAFSLNTAAFAQTYTAASVSGNSVELNLSSDYGRAQYTIYLLKPGGELPADEKGISTAFDKIESIDASGDISGVFKRHVVNFEFDEGAPYGVYKAIIGGGELDGKIIDITYANPSEEQTAVAEVNGASASTIGAVLSKYQDKVWSLDVDKAIYQSNKSEVETNVAAILGGGASSSSRMLRRHLKRRVCCQKLKIADSADIYHKTIFI